MTKRLRAVLVGLLVLLGLGLMVGGIATGKSGAVVVGLCVAAVAMQQWIVMSNQAKQGDK